MSSEATKPAPQATDLIAKLDALAEARITKDEWTGLCGSYLDETPILGLNTGAPIGEIVHIEDAKFITAIVNAWPQLRAELLAARDVCEAWGAWSTAKGRTESVSAMQSLDNAFAAWRAAREVSK